MTHPNARRMIPVTALALVALAGALLLFTRDAAAANQSVSISGFAFAPATVTVNVGDTVTWTNNDAGIPHTASSDTPGIFDSGNMTTGATFAKTFDTAGSFAYHCNIHPSMTGMVVVQGQAASPTATTAAATATATTAAATATPTAAAATATTAAPTATTAAASPTSASSPAGGGTAVSGTPAGGATSAPQPPSTGDGSGDDGGSNALLIGAGIAVLVLAAGGVGYGVMRRRA